ncbi:MAG: 16S rRNA (cytidine(1402)-2'-O)-methyltransferase [Clostridiales bacterium]|jgi:16S rRNA (cytidine1402-2'-O)-methyltransferase|nr:16S rRNA (cytidine(1402)-2'-O)-methyltransferase [Clostridiales bacterium]
MNKPDKTVKTEKTAALYVVATPIGNLGDLSARALKTLEDVDFIAAEDTRRAAALLNAFGIKKPVIGYYKDKEKSRAEVVLQRLKNGESAALISDAGTPAISDPGAVLVARARDEGIAVYTVPGACAAVAAFSICGLPSGYVFFGFLRGRAKDRRAALEPFKGLALPLIFYSAPHDVNDDLQFLYSELGDRSVYAAREMTKIYEEFIVGTLGGLRFENPRGEFVLIVGGLPKDVAYGGANADVGGVLRRLLDGGTPSKEAIKAAAKAAGLPKDAAYKEYLKIKEDLPL